MRIGSLALPLSWKTFVAAATVVVSAAAATIPAVAAPAPRVDTAIAGTLTPRPIDHDAAYFATAAQATATLAAGKVDTTALRVQIALVTESRDRSADAVATLTDQLRQLTAATAAQVVAYDAEQARIAAEQAAAQAAAEAAAQAAAASQSYNSPAPSGGPTAGNSPDDARAYAQQYMAANYGWGSDQFSCLDSLWNRESGWNYQAYNSGSGATGIPQALPGSKMASAGSDWQTSAATQVRWGLGYIAGSYGTPCGAWGHSQSTGWY